MQEKEPWILAKQLESNPEQQALIDNCMFNCLQLTANLAILINPFLPSTAKKMCYMMKVVDKMCWQSKITQCRLFIEGAAIVVQKNRG